MVSLVYATFHSTLGPRIVHESPFTGHWRQGVEQALSSYAWSAAHSDPFEAFTEWLIPKPFLCHRLVSLLVHVTPHCAYRVYGYAVSLEDHVKYARNALLFNCACVVPLESENQADTALFVLRLAQLLQALERDTSLLSQAGHLREMSLRQVSSHSGYPAQMVLARLLDTVLAQWLRLKGADMNLHAVASAALARMTGSATLVGRLQLNSWQGTRKSNNLPHVSLQSVPVPIQHSSPIPNDLCIQAVWQACNGHDTVQQMARRLQADIKLVQMAVQHLVDYQWVHLQSIISFQCRFTCHAKRLLLDGVSLEVCRAMRRDVVKGSLEPNAEVIKSLLLSFHPNQTLKEYCESVLVLSNQRIKRIQFMYRMNIDILRLLRTALLREWIEMIEL